MAAGDLAASQAGFVPALSSDDLRLGFGKIDEAADLAFKYGALSFANAAALLAYTGGAIGQRAIDRATNDEYRWLTVGGTPQWGLWSTGWKNYTATYTNLTPGTGAALTHRYRYVDGMVEVFGYIGLWTGNSVGTSPAWSLPVQPNAAASTDQWMLLGGGFLGTPTGAGQAQAVPRLAGSAGSYLLKPRALQVSGTAIVEAEVTATLPKPWGSGDVLCLTVLYRVY